MQLIQLNTCILDCSKVHASRFHSLTHSAEKVKNCTHLIDASLHSLGMLDSISKLIQKTIVNISQDSVLKVRGLMNCKFTAEYASQRILKIG